MQKILQVRPLMPLQISTLLLVKMARYSRRFRCAGVVDENEDDNTTAATVQNSTSGVMKLLQETFIQWVISLGSLEILLQD